MDLFTWEDFKALASYRQGICASVYLQMYEKGKETRQNAIRFKNALNEVKTVLDDRPEDASDVRETLAPLEALLDDGAFWRSQSQGLAVFVGSGISRVYRLPLILEDLHIVAGRFHLKPVLPLICENLRFYILALSQNSTRFYLCDRLHIDPLTVENMPKDIDDALRYEMEQRQFQFYTGAPVARGTHRRTAVFHGQGFAAREQNDRLLRYCRMIDNAVFDVLRNETAPLVLAAVEKLSALYREATGFPYLQEDVIVGNPEHVSAADLHRQAWQIVSAELDLRRQSAIEKYNSLKGTGYTTEELPSIVRRAFEGRIDRLILGAQAHRWGRCDENGLAVEPLDARTQAPDTLDLLDVAACETLLKGGEVWSIDSAAMPTRAPAAATLRY